MAGRRKKSGEDWLLRGTKTTSRKPRAKSAGAPAKRTEWRLNGRRTKTPRERKLEAKLRRAEDARSALNAEINRLQRRILELEARLRRGARDRRGGRSRTGDGGPGHGRSRRPALSEATTEQLLEAGLTPRQSARVRAHQRGGAGFSRWRDLEELSGLSAPAVDKLRRSFRLRPG